MSLAVEVLDPKGVPKTDLKPEDLSVFEGEGEERSPRRVLGVEPIGGGREARPWRVAIYFDRMLSGTRTLRGAAGALAAQARELVALGPVEVVVAEPEPRVVLPATRDAAAVDEALSRLLLMGEGRDDLRAIRRRFTQDAAVPGGGEGDLEGRIGEAVSAEVRLAGRQQDLLLEWLAEASGEGPRALLVVSDGFDPVPAEFYLPRVADAGARSELGRILEGESLQGRAEEVARTAAELGWTVLPLPVGDERLPELRRVRPTPNPEVPIQITVTPGRREKKGSEPPAPPLLLRSKEPLAWLAHATGGEVLTSSAAVGPSLVRLRSRLWLRYEAPLPASGRPVEVRARNAELAVRAPQRVGPAVPEGVSAVRARRLLEGDEIEGELAVSSVLRLESLGETAPGARTGRLEVRLPELADPSIPLRLTLAVLAGETGTVVEHRELAPAGRGADGAWRLDLPLAPEVERIAVLVADPGRRLWGGEVLDVRSEEAGEEIAAGEPAEAVSRVEPRAWTGRGVRIVRPAEGRAQGPVDVEVDVRLPPERRLERLEIFWNDELAATLYGPPFRHRVTVPPNQRAGYLRAAARLDDGSTAEDAVLLNAAAHGDRLDVRLVELYVVVTDRDGRPVTGLSRADFRLLQDGREQEVSGFDDAGESPLLLGLAFDSSASMFLKLPDVQKAARTLLAGGLSRRDRALLVDFDTKPRLLVGATGNLAEVSAGLRALQADGGSNLFEAVQFSIEQLGRMAGRRALIVYSDGIGEGEGGYRSCLRAARRSGIPVYLIVTNARAARNAIGGALADPDPYAGKLDRLAAATGGRAYFVLPSQDLGAVYQEILRELRSQYLLTYYPRETAQEVWRKVDVEVRKRGLRARTLSGYYADGKGGAR